MDDPKLKELRRQIALLNIRFEQLAGRLDQGETGSLFGDLRAQWAVLQSARQQGNGAAVAQALDAVGQLIVRGGEQEELWGQIVGICGDVQKAVHAETERELVAHAMMSHGEVIGLVTMLGQEIIAEIGQHADGVLANEIKQGVARRLDRYLSSRPRAVEVEVPKVIQPEGVVDESGRIGAARLQEPADASGGPAAGQPEGVRPAAGAEGGAAGAAGPGAAAGGVAAPEPPRPAGAEPGDTGESPTAVDAEKPG